MDRALEEQYPSENRWDYLLGYAPGLAVVGLEPHSAKQDEISTVIRKKQAAGQQLATHLKPGERVAEWYWVASGKVYFADTEKARRRLDQHGIRFVGRKLLRKHLPPDRPRRRARGRPQLHWGRAATSVEPHGCGSTRQVTLAVVPGAASPWRRTSKR